MIRVKFIEFSFKDETAHGRRVNEWQANHWPTNGEQTWHFDIRYEVVRVEHMSPTYIKVFIRRMR